MYSRQRRGFIKIIYLFNQMLNANFLCQIYSEMLVIDVASTTVLTVQTHHSHRYRSYKEFLSVLSDKTRGVRGNRIGVKLSAAVIYSSKIMFMLVKVKVKVNFKRQDFLKICSLTLNPEVQLRYLGFLYNQVLSSCTCYLLILLID